MIQDYELKIATGETITSYQSIDKEKDVHET